MNAKRILGRYVCLGIAVCGPAPASRGAAATIQYAYDVAGRLLSADYGGGAKITYTYDANGNLLERIATPLDVVDTTPPANVAGFTAAPGDGQVGLAWSNPGDTDFAGVKILRKTGGYPAHPSDGTVVYTGTGNAATDTGLVNGTEYFYKAFSFDNVPNYADGATARATPAAPAPAWDAGYQDIGGGWRRLAWFGDYVPMGGEGWIWHNRHGFFFVPANALPESIWLYAQDMGWLWTGNNVYPFLFRNLDSAWLWYNGSTNPRWFVNMATGQWESWMP